jgi:predicted helicase
VSESRLEFLLEKLDEIWNVYGSDKVGKGGAFERLMASYLRTAPEFSDRFDEVYLWQDWPERGAMHDHGIDIVAKDLHTGGWCAVQCKFYNPQHHVSKADIDSFLAASAKKQFTGRIIVSTAKDWGPTAESQLDGLTVPVTRIGVNDLLESQVDWSQIDWQEPQTYLPLTGKKQLRPHQSAAKDAAVTGLATHDRGQLIMACGTGKTFTSLKIAEQLATDNKAKATTVLFLVPSIQLVNQTFREWAQESELPFRAFAVCSDVKVGKSGPRPKDDPEDIAVHDLIIPATTDTKALAAKVREAHENDRFTVIFSTYQSIDVVSQAQRDGVPEFDLVIADEAHRTTGVTLADTVESQFVRVHDNSYIKAAKRLYMTATPRLFDPKVKDKATASDAVLVSMDDESLYGPVLHRLGFGEAVEKDLLTDYKVLVLKVDEGFVAESFQSELAQSGEIKLEDAAKLIGCWNGLAKRFGDTLTTDDLDGDDLTPMKTAVAFAANIRASKAARETFPSIVDRLISTYAEEEDTGAERTRNRMKVDIRHVDGTMNAVDRGNELAWLRSGSDETENVCRVLTNVRCLSEGVDVPSLDAVMFLTPRGSQVDIVQSVGRVMRKAAGKKLGYIILPVVVPAGMSPEAALADNKRFEVVWEVLQALRAHDDRFNAMVNQLDLNKKKNSKVVIIDGGGGSGSSGSDDSTQLTLPFGIEEWRDAIYARIVKKVGERRYWETWAKDVAKIAEQHIARITGLLADEESSAAKEFEAFLGGLRGNLNDGITRADAIEMLAQHLITRPVFEALFAGYDFAANNPVAQTMERMLAVLDEHSLDAENSELERFYTSVRGRVEGVDNAEGRQRIIIELYDKFFATAFKRTVDKLGIVYTPVEIVDFILSSADEVMREHFGKGLTDEGVHILDGFTGTGTFMVRLLQSGLIEPHDLARKYANELHANEILLLAYYIAAVNIETTYQDLVRGSLDETAAYEPFPGLVLTDTFQSYEHGDEDDLGVFPENNERINRQRRLPITVIVGNPPYSSGQDSANENNQNTSYPGLDASIRDTYSADRGRGGNNSLYDSYIRAIRWATLRIADRGVVAIVTNGGWLDSNVGAEMRLSLAAEFSAIHIFNLRGNARTAGEQRKKEGGSVFDAGSRATVAITVLVKDPTQDGSARITFSDVGDYLTREQKLAKVAATGRFRGRTDRSGSSGGAGVPAVGGPGLPEQAAGDDNGVGQGDEGVDDAVVSFGADGELLESSVVPGVGALDDPAGSGLQGEPLDADHAVAAEFVEQVTGLGAVIPGIQVHRDPLGKSYPEPLVEAGEFGQGWAQQRGVVPVRRCDHAPQGDAGAVDEQGSFRAELASVHGRFARDVTAAGGLDDAPVDDHIRQVQPHDLVVGVQAELLELLEDPGVDPLITSGADRGRRAGRVRDPRVARAQDQHLDQLVEHDPVGDPWTVTPQRVRVHMVRDQRGELVPQRFDQRGWQSRHGRLPGAIGFDTSSPTRVRACTPSATRTPAVTSAPIRATS